MSTKVLKTIDLDGIKGAKLSLANISKPYGEDSKDVLSIGLSLKSDSDVDWKIHVPYEDISKLIASLEQIQQTKL